MMYGDPDPDPYRSSQCAGSDRTWDNLGLGWLFQDPYAEAKTFYGPEVFRRLYEQEQAQRNWELVKRKAGESGRLIDDVAGQLRGGV